MGKRRGTKQLTDSRSKKRKADQTPTERIEALLEQDKYVQAINTFQSLDPEELASVERTEASLWLKRGGKKTTSKRFGVSSGQNLGMSTRTMKWTCPNGWRCC